jgi:GNAT superfamily N-acetyltransferase
MRNGEFRILNYRKTEKGYFKMNIFEINNGEYLISTDKSKLDISLIHKYLSEESYWAKNIPIETVAQSIKNSLSFGVYFGNQQIGFARIISDFTTFAYLADVFILTEFRGKGLSKWLLDAISAHPNLQNLRRWMLMTHDAQGLYSQKGWSIAKYPERVMEKAFPDIYTKNKI